jgi:spore coat protein A
MAITRRQFLKYSAVAGAAASLPLSLGVHKTYAFSQSPTIRKFVTTLPGLGPTGANNIGQYIPLATKHTVPFAGKSTDLYDLAVAQFKEKMHPDLPNPTNLFGYVDLFNLQQKYLAGVIVAKRGTPILLTVTNLIPPKHILPVDPTVMAGPNGLMVGDLPLNRHVTHLHGGLTPWFSDGTPFQWYTPFGQHGPSFMNVPGTFPPPGTATHYYPMDQSARMIWYHDHAMGITRLNAYAGIASAFIITDDFEDFLVNHGLLPDLVGVPLVLQDKTFLDPSKDPKYPVSGAMAGDLWYPHEYEKNSLPKGKGRWDYGPDVTPTASVTGPLPAISVVPEYFSDTAMVNGAPYPVLNVTDMTLRFRILNASQARFWHLNLYMEDPNNPGELLIRDEKPVLGPALVQVGTEGGFLPKSVVHPNGIPCPLNLVADPTGNTANPDGPFNLLMAPAERADIMIDFTGMKGRSFLLYNDAPAPFPGGDPRNDYYTGNPDFTNPTSNIYGLSGGAPSTKPLSGPNTRTIMRISVSPVSGPRGPMPNLNELDMALGFNFTGGNPGVDPQQPSLLAYFDGTQFVIPAGAPISNKSLNEDFDDLGRLLQRGGTDQVFTNTQGLPTFGQGYMDSITEVVSAGTVQAWDFYNTTGDTHPWHFHLVNVQIAGRGIYATDSQGLPIFGQFTDLNGKHGQFTPPNPNELGWKETVRMNPGEITRVIMRFDLPKIPKSMGNPLSPRTGGHEYVHHCHILEHEEHDMMRVLKVI